MATRHRTDLAQNWIVQYLLMDTLQDARDLLRRFQEVEDFRLYVLGRMALVIPAVLVIFLIGIACAMGLVVFLADMHSLLLLLAILLLPVVLVGSLFVQGYVFFSWIEGRSLAQALGRRHGPPSGALASWLQKKFGLDMSPFPPVPWLLSAIVMFTPLVMLAFSWLGAALVVLALAILTPILYALFDR